MSQMQFTIAFTPNACHGPPHIGHLWTMVHARYLYEQMKWRSELNIHGRYWQGDLDVKWAVFFDINSRSEHQPAFLEMANWLGWQFDFSDHAKEWAEFCGAGAPRAPVGILNCLFQLPHHETGLDFNAHASKLLWMNAKGVYWHPRGYDLIGLEVAERDITRYIPLRKPIPIYHPVLNSVDGAKIGGMDVPAEYLVSDLYGRDPDAVVAALCKACGFRGTWDNDIQSSENLLAISKPITRHIQQFHCTTRGNNGVDHNALHKVIRVPRAWKTHIRDYEHGQLEQPRAGT